MTELELKFHVPPDILASLEAELRRRGGRTVRLLARYFDTPAADLAANGLALRLRREGRRWVQTLKAAGDNVVRRLEYEVDMRLPQGAEAPALDVTAHEGSEAGARLREVLERAGGARALVEVYRTDVRRLVCDLKVLGADVEAALDTGSIRAGEKAASLCELELELKSGPTSALIQLAKAWVVHGSLWLSTVSKAERGLRLARGAAFGTPQKAVPPRLDADTSGRAALHAIVRSCVDQIGANASDVAAGSVDEEHVHQLRVGLRRMRTALRELAALDAGFDARWDAPLAAAFRRLGEVRDEQTVAAAARRLLESADAPLVTWSSQAAEDDPGQPVRDAAFQATLLELLCYTLREESAGRDLTPKSFRRHVERRLAKLHRQVARGGRRFESLPAARQHQVRKRLKRLRYLAEFVAGLYDDAEVTSYLERLEAAQDALGAHNDAVVALGKFREEAERDERALVAAGWLQDHLRSTARKCHACIGELADTQPFWKARKAH